MIEKYIGYQNIENMISIKIKLMVVELIEGTDGLMKQRKGFRKVGRVNMLV